MPLTSRLVEVLKGHRAATRIKGELVFPADDGTLSIHQDHVDRPLKGSLKLAGLPTIRFHDLRRSFASQLVSVGRSIKDVQELLGHESVQMTMRSRTWPRSGCAMPSRPWKRRRHGSLSGKLGTFWEHERKKPGYFRSRAFS